MSEFTTNIVSAQQLARLSAQNAGLLGLFGFHANVGAVTPNTGLIVNVAAIGSGNYTINGALQTNAYAGGTVTHSAAHATLPRIDTIYISTAGAVAISEGTPALQPVPPDLTSARLEVAQVLVAAAASSIGAGAITDRRQMVDLSTPLLKYKTAGQNFVNTTPAAITATSGNVSFPLLANTAYELVLDMHMSAVGTAGSGGWLMSLTGPAAPTRVTAYGHAASTSSQNADSAVNNERQVASRMEYTADGTAFGTIFNAVAAAADATGGAGGMTTGTVRITVYILNGANAGTLAVLGCQNAAAGTTTLNYLTARLTPVGLI